MNLRKDMPFASPETYVSGMTALSIPDEGRLGGDWHFVAALCHPNSRLQSAGVLGTLTNTNLFLGNAMVVDKAEILRHRGIDPSGTRVFCALHPRAVVDLLYHSLSKDAYPGHVLLDGGVFEEEIEFAMMEELMKLMVPHLSASQRKNLSRWRGEHFSPAKDGVSA